MISSIISWIKDLFECMCGCFGCCTKPTPIKAVDEATNGRKIQGWTVKKPTTSDDFWSSSTRDVDNSTFQSQRSIQSVSTLNQILGTSTEGNDHEFVNRGLLLWNESRLKWIGSDSPKNQTQQTRETRLNANETYETYETLLGSRRLFPKPVPLSEMVEFLVNVWEQEGMYY
ncbi:hypothetical protein Lalb_Chr23g0275391 [Lupinus albus]|uniref:Gag1-like clamp domain-containing protein n=1 Tax=Lupinus albus TaxID=3870 RepID=A0A6A4NJQ9_LUPAL|nr:hypothetical protein Lalb_Chr23g0275391 [Lupinus albus]